MDPFGNAAAGLVPAAGRRSGSRGSIPDEKFSELFAAAPSHRDRALVAFWISTGARASELLGATCRAPIPGSS